MDNSTLSAIVIGYYANLASILFLLILFKIYLMMHPEKDMFKVDRYLRNIAVSNLESENAKGVIICAIIPFALMFMNLVKGHGVIKYFSDHPRNSFVDFLVDFREHKIKHPDAISLYYPKYK